MDLPDLNSSGERLAWARERKGWSLAEAARRTDTAKSTYRKDESGERAKLCLPEHRARTYGRVFGVPWLWLCHGNSARTDQFRPDEITLIEKYRRKDEVGQSAIQSIADALPDIRDEAM